MAIFYYNTVLKKLIKNIKYRLSTQVWHEFANAIQPQDLEKISFFRRLPVSFQLQPIPLHAERLQMRGFNQAYLLAEFFAEKFRFPISAQLERQKSTLPQAQIIKRQERYVNVQGAFLLRPKASVGKANIILIDDVTTSGLTLKAAAYPIKKAGAASVYAVTLAKG